MSASNVGFWRKLSQQFLRNRPLSQPASSCLAFTSTMDFLKAEIAAKRKVLDEDPTALSGRPNKYMRRGDLERLKEEQERKAQEEKRKQEEESKRKEAEARAAEQQARRDAAAAKSKVSDATIDFCVSFELNRGWRAVYLIISLTCRISWSISF